MPSTYSGRTANRLRLYIKQERIEGDRYQCEETGPATVYRQLENHLSAIIGNARLIQLEMPDLPDSVRDRIDRIAETTQRISALLYRQQDDTDTAAEPGVELHR